MKRLIVDAVLIALVAVVAYTIRGDAQTETYPAFGQPVQIVCNQGELSNAQANQTVSGVTITWQALPGVTQSQFRQLAIFNDCVLYPMAPAP